MARILSYSFSWNVTVFTLSNTPRRWAWIVCESLAWPKISSKAGSDTKKKRGNTRRFFSRYLCIVNKKYLSSSEHDNTKFILRVYNIIFSRIAYPSHLHNWVVIILRCLPAERFLTNLKLFKDVRQQLSQRVVTHTTLHNIGILVGSAHDLHPGFVNLAKTLGFLWIKKLQENTINSFSQWKIRWN